MTANDPAIGARIGAQRNALRVTQLALADALGITVEQLRRYEAGRRPISARRLRQIAGLLGVPVAAFTSPDSNAVRTGSTNPSLLDSAAAMRLLCAHAAPPTPRMRRALLLLAERLAEVETQVLS